MSLLPARSKAAPRASASAVGSLVLHRARLLKRIRHAAHHRHLTVTNSARLANLLLGHAAQERDSCKPWADPLGRVLGLPSLGYPVGWSPGCGRDVGRYSGLPGRTRGAGAIRPKGTETASPFSKKNRIRLFPRDYCGLRGEGSIPVPLPPPAWPQSSVLCATLLAISPYWQRFLTRARDDYTAK